MADSSSSHSFNTTHLQDPSPTSNSSSNLTKPSKSKFFFTHYFLSKSLVIILVLLVFTFFPSQVPEFFKKSTIINKIWELIYLLVIGIAVCYGLFSRKIDSVHSFDESAHSDDNSIGVKDSYLSGISHISSIFEDGVQNSYGFDEKDLFEGSEFGKKSDGKKQNQYFLGESLVVINDEKYVLEQFSKPKTLKQNRGSKSLDSATGKSVVNDCSNGGESIKKGKFKGLVPIKLEEKFKDVDSDSDSDSDSRIPLNWRSKSMRFEKQDDNCNDKANEEIIRSKSSRFSMQPQMKKSSEKEELNFNFKEKEEILNNKTSILKPKPRKFSIASSSIMNNHSIPKDFGKTKETVNDFSKANVDHGNKSKMDLETFDYDSRKEEKSDLSNSIPKPVPIYKRGKSVRTNRVKDQILEAKVETNGKDETNMNVNVNVNHDEAPIVSDNLSDAEPHSGEVDRKAAEFIAKFREQIRLQQATPARRLNLW